ncbi:Hpt domain-containing protein [Paenibacillus sp. sgz5001063]|uniref:Hpt domain-containing protein n=1 Tax=Paenibacillus sp. sgz5001063 TaxID=3242474 RepID=UPI0036D2FC90
MESPFQVWIDEDIAELIPGYMGRRREDLANLSSLLEIREFEAIANIGHSMKGSGGGYGLFAISEIGRDLERDGGLRDGVLVKSCLDRLEYYLEHVEILIKPCER